MKNKTITSLFVFFVICLINAGSLVIRSTMDSPINYASVKEGNKYKDRFIVKLKSDLSSEEKAKFLKENNLNVRKYDTPDSGSNILYSNTSSLLDLQYIEAIEEDQTIHTQSTEINDPLFKDQWYLKGIGYDYALNKLDPSDSVVAVIDSGICLNHPDLQGRILQGWNFIDNNTDVNDELGHGCEVSGIIAANINNDIGIAGSSINTKVMPLKIIESDGMGSYSNLIDAIDYAIVKKVNIINISLGGIQDSAILHSIVTKAKDAGIIIVASAGNTGNSEILYPAKYSEVFSVGSVENDYTISTFSSNTQDIKLWAFGSSVITANKDNDYSKVSGTSLSAALVSAFIAQGGEYKENNIINFISKELRPIFQNKLTDIEEKVSGLKFKVPEKLGIEGFENQNPTSFIINWQKVINVASGETLTVSVWNRNSNQEIKEVYETILEQDGCKDYKEKSACLRNYPSKVGQNSGYGRYFLNENTLVRVQYAFHNFIGFNIFKSIALSLTLKDKNLFTASDFKSLKESISKDIVYVQGANYCGGFYDTNNPYDCCSSDESGQNDANCTWYAAYKRPDLKGTITLWPEGLWAQAQQAGFPTSSDQPKTGALIVWQLHVAYVEAYTSSSVTWSEQNCYNTNNPFNASVTRNSYTPGYAAGNFLGYIYFKDDCNGTNVTMTNWSVTNSKTCNPQGSLTILPESVLSPGSGLIVISPH
jgi:hypothetical protein